MNIFETSSVIGNYIKGIVSRLVIFQVDVQMNFFIRRFYNIFKVSQTHTICIISNKSTNGYKKKWLYNDF